MDDFFERLVTNRKLMSLVDCLNINVSDHHDGYGMMDGSFHYINLGKLRFGQRKNGPRRVCEKTNRFC